MKLIDSGKKSCVDHMAKDTAILQSLTSSQEPILHFYEWERPSITYGHFIKPEEILDLEQLRFRSIPIAKRPTGGGLLFHWADFSFTLAIPATHSKFSKNTHDNYSMINGAVLQALEEFLPNRHRAAMQVTSEPTPLCMAACSKYDVAVNGIKIGGAAERSTKDGLIHQSSIFIKLPNWDEIAPLLLDRSGLDQMKHASHALIHNLPIDEIRREIGKRLHREFQVLFTT